MNPRRAAGFTLALLVAPAFSGCTVISLATTAVSATVTVVETAVDVTVGAVKGAATVAGKAVDAARNSPPAVDKTAATPDPAAMTGRNAPVASAAKADAK